MVGRIILNPLRLGHGTRRAQGALIRRAVITTRSRRIKDNPPYLAAALQFSGGIFEAVERFSSRDLFRERVDGNVTIERPA